MTTTLVGQDFRNENGNMGEMIHQVESGNVPKGEMSRILEHAVHMIGASTSSQFAQLDHHFIRSDQTNNFAHLLLASRVHVVRTQQIYQRIVDGQTADVQHRGVVQKCGRLGDVLVKVVRWLQLMAPEGAAHVRSSIIRFIALANRPVPRPSAAQRIIGAVGDSISA